MCGLPVCTALYPDWLFEITAWPKNIPLSAKDDNILNFLQKKKSCLLAPMLI